jgi:hypothetical protein
MVWADTGLKAIKKGEEGEWRQGISLAPVTLARLEIFNAPLKGEKWNFAIMKTELHLLQMRFATMPLSNRIYTL